MALTNDINAALALGNASLIAEPGAGKSTGLPLALLMNGNLSGSIILLEPRRLAARSVASRLASHLNEQVGQRVGLRMRSETSVSEKTQLTVVTEGVLTRLLQTDPMLDGVALVIFDEFHERSLHADVGLTLCLEVQRELRNDLRLLLMSATLDAKSLQKHLPEVKQFHCTVRQFPVSTVWVGESNEPLEQCITRTVVKALSEQSGDVLVFLPGVAEINRTATLLQPKLSTNTELHRLHSSVSTREQLKATGKSHADRRRVILSTSLSETSITIEGVSVVVDSGLERRGKVDTVTGAMRLETVMASQASAVQRAGRAGRTSPGVCYRLWNESAHSRRPTHWQPEIERADLSPLVLELGLWGTVNTNALPWLSPPPAGNLKRAEKLLQQLGLWRNQQLTPTGKVVASLPLHPRLGNMLHWASTKGAGVVACKLAVLLEEQNSFTNSTDLGPLLNADLPTSLQRRVDRLVYLLETATNKNELPSAAVVLAQAYPDWIAQRRPGESGKFLLACGAGALLNKDDELARTDWLVVAQLGGAGKQLSIFKAMELNIHELELYSPELFHSEKYLDWDTKEQRVIAEQRQTLGCLIVDSRPTHDINQDDKARALTSGIKKLGITSLPWNAECREWQARAEKMNSIKLPQSDLVWPEVSDDALLAQLDNWLLPWLNGVASIKALQRLDLYKALNAMLDYKQQVLMDEYLPTRYTVPSGSRIKLSYVQGDNPVLSVRLQEMLGCSENPAIAKGQIPLKVELLSPAQRPVQVTTDLKNFWHNSYPAVKKEMAGRYPKHFWPDDPLTAQPRSGIKKRK